MLALYTKNRLKNGLLVYWIGLPILFYSYLVLTALKEHVTLAELLQQVPGLALGTLISSMLIIQAACLFMIQNVSKSRQGLLGKWLWFAMAQQIITANIIGAGLCFFYEKTLVDEAETTSLKLLFVVSMISFFVGLLSLLAAFIVWNLAH